MRNTQRKFNSLDLYPPMHSLLRQRVVQASAAAHRHPVAFLSTSAPRSAVYRPSSRVVVSQPHLICMQLHEPHTARYLLGTFLKQGHTAMIHTPPHWFAHIGLDSSLRFFLTSASAAVARVHACITHIVSACDKRERHLQGKTFWC